MAFPPALVCVALNVFGQVKELNLKHWAKSFATAKEEKHLKNLDKALLSAHTKRLYDHLHRAKETNWRR